MNKVECLALLRALRFRIALVLVMVAVSAAVVVWFGWRKFEAEQVFAQAQQRARQANERWANFEQEAQQSQRHRLAWQALLDRGMVGPEQRLDWIETLEGSRKRHQLAPIRYRVGPQSDLAPTLMPQTPRLAYGYRASPVRLALSLVHEGDLLALLDDLAADGPALPRVRRCVVERLPEAEENEGPPNLAPAHLKAECDLDWISLQSSGSGP